ncbi:MAG: DNA alkylation repair protein [Actinomycetes bacterium]
MPADPLLIDDLRRSLRAAADPTRAPAMQRYMKSALPFYGVPSPVARRVFAGVLAAHPLADREAWESTVRALWHDATHREERYGALALAGHGRYREHQDPATLVLYRELIVTGAWWDLVDDLAAHKVGPILRAHHDVVRPTIAAWATDEDMWLRRAAIISQLGSKGDIDLDLLVCCIEPNLDDREFFIRKAIGWALRQHAWHDPDWVRVFVREHEDRLSPLSRREALKNVGAA